MIKTCMLLVVALVLALLLPIIATGQLTARPETVVVHHGSITLHALLWRPQGRGPFPAILCNHGSGRTREELERLGPYEGQAETLGPVFARHGYVFLFLFRQGVGLSADQGTSAVDLMNSEFAAHGQDARNALQLRLLENRELSAAASGLAFCADLLRSMHTGWHSLPTRSEVPSHSCKPRKNRIFGRLCFFSSAGYSWDRSPELRKRLLDAVAHIRAPIFFIHAANDYSVNPGKALDARLVQLRRPHRLKIYPPIGRTPDDGHNFPLLGVSIWEPDVFAFLDEYMRK